MPEAIDFKVTNDSGVMGTYMYDDSDSFEHTITISSAKCGHYYTMITTLSHEMVHCSFHRQKGDRWREHGEKFRVRCRLVAKELGFDGNEL